MLFIAIDKTKLVCYNTKSL